MPLITRLKSLAPDLAVERGSQFGHRIQKHRNGINSRVSPKNGLNPSFGTIGPALLTVPIAIVCWYTFPLPPNRLAASWLNALWNPAFDPNSITRKIAASAAIPM